MIELKLKENKGNKKMRKNNLKKKKDNIFNNKVYKLNRLN